MDAHTAYEIALSYVGKLAEAVSDKFDIVEEDTVQVSKGWVFFYNSAAFVCTRNISDSLAGNGPILVKSDGSVIELPSAIPWQEALHDI